MVNRALIMATLAKKKVILQQLTLCTDTQTCIQGLQNLGISIDALTSETYEVHNQITTKKKEVHLDVGPSGTTMRFLTALAPFFAESTYLTGNEQLNVRPIQDLGTALSALGVEVRYLGEQGYPPIQLSCGSNFPNRQDIVVAASTSSQYVSALLMCLPLLPPEVRLCIQNKQILSRSYIDLTLSVMKDFGFEVKEIEPNVFQYVSQTESPNEYRIEGDWSAATFWFGYTALSGKKTTLLGLNPHSVQGERAIMDIMKEMGVNAFFEGEKCHILPPEQPLKAINVNLSSLPDAAMMLAVLAAFAQGTSIFEGLSSLQYKETKRLSALQIELTKMGIKVNHTQDTLTIEGGSPQKALIHSYHDHRMAMAFAMASTKIPYLALTYPECVEKSYPKFWGDFAQTGVLHMKYET